MSLRTKPRENQLYIAFGVRTDTALITPRDKELPQILLKGTCRGRAQDTVNYIGYPIVSLHRG